MGINIRTISEIRHGPLRDQIASYLGPDVAVAPVVDVESVWTDLAHPWMHDVELMLSRHAAYRRSASVRP
jgi:hypothetical protein